MSTIDSVSSPPERPEPFGVLTGAWDVCGGLQCYRGTHVPLMRIMRLFFPQVFPTDESWKKARRDYISMSICPA